MMPDRKMIGDTTDEILSIIAPHVGVVDYGMLRIPKHVGFPDVADYNSERRIFWALQYSHLLGSSRDKALVYVPDSDSWGVEAGSYVDKIRNLGRDGALNALRETVAGIPRERDFALKSLRESGIDLVKQVLKDSNMPCSPTPLDKLLSSKELATHFSPEQIAELRSKCYKREGK